MENLDVMKRLSKGFEKKLRKLLRALAKPTYRTYLRLSDPLPRGHVVDYDVVFGRPASVKEVGELLGKAVGSRRLPGAACCLLLFAKAWSSPAGADLTVSRTQLQMGAKRRRVEAEAVEGGIEPTLVMPKANEPI